MAMDWVGTKPGKFVNESTLVPINAENLNAVVDTVEKIVVGADDTGINATTLQGVYKEGFATAEDVGLTNYYSFDAFDGSVLLDDSVYEQHASTFNVTRGEGVEGGGGIFNGTSSYVQGGYTNGTEFTLSIFFKGTSALANKPLLTLFNTSTSYKLGLFVNAGVAELRIRNTAGTINTATGSVINDNKWHHILGTYDGVNASIYVDGEIKQSIASSLITSYYNLFRIGASEEESPISFTAGSVDEVRIYTRHLTTNEVNGLFLTKNGSKSIKVSQENIASSLAMRKSDGSLEATTFNIPEDGSSTYNLKLANNSGLTADHTLTLNTNNSDRTVSLGGDITTAGAITTSGAYGITFTATGTTSVTLPTSGTLAKVDSQVFTGTPSLPSGTTGVTQPAGTSNTTLATTEFVTTVDNLKANLDSPTFTGTPSLPTGTIAVTQAPGNSTTAVATTAFVTAADNLKANIDSPTFTGTPSLPTGTIAVTQSPGNSTTAVATTAFVTAADNLKANIDSPVFTGTPSLPTGTTGVTQAADTNNTSLATTAFVIGQKGTTTPLVPTVSGSAGSSLKYSSQDHVHPANFTSNATDIKMNGVQSVGSLLTFPRADHVHPSDTTKANIDSPIFTGTPSLPTGTTGVTQIAGTSNTTLATTEFVTTADNLKANLDSPIFTGTPSLPTGTIGVTQAVGTSNTTLATTAFVNNEIANDIDYLADFRSYDATRTYGLNDPTFYNGVPYRSLSAGNIGHTPSTSPTYWEVTGGGASSSNPGINFTNGTMDSNVNGWSTYADAAGTTPVDGTGGTANITFAYSSTNPLIGTGMGLLTKDAVNRQGQGVSYNFTVDLGARSKPLKIEFEYQTEGTYADGDIGCYVYDTTNAVLLYPSFVSLPSTGGMPNHFESSLLLNQNSGSYRLIFHIQSTSASAYTMKLDNVQIQPMEPQLGAAIGNWNPWTPTISSIGSILNIKAYWRREGDSIHMKVSLQCGSAGSTESIILYPPSGLTLDTTKASNWIDSSSTAAQGSGVWRTTSSVIPLIPIIHNGGLSFFKNNNVRLLGTDLATNHELGWDVTIPISQWTSNINLAADFTEYASNTGGEGVAANTTYTNPAYISNSPDGSNIPAVTTGIFDTQTKYKVTFTRPIQVTDKLFLEIKHGNSLWTDANSADSGGMGPVIQNSIKYGLWMTTDISDTTNRSILVCFNNGGAIPTGSTYGSKGINWSVYNTIKWRVRKVSNGNMAEVPSTIFQPLTGIVSSGANVTYTLPFAVGERKAYIPQAYLKTTGTAGTLTITTGSGTPLVIPLAASTDTITSGDALISVYVAPNGSVVAENWSISGSNSNGTWIKSGDGTMKQWGDYMLSGNGGTDYVGYLYYPTLFYANPPFIVGNAWNGAHGNQITTTSQVTLLQQWSDKLFFAIKFAYAVPSGYPGILHWMAIGRWR